MMRLKWLPSLIAFAMAICIAAGSHAAVISVQPIISGFFDTDFGPIPAPAPVPGGGTVNTHVAIVVQIDVYMEVLSLAPGEDSFGTAAFSFEMGDTIPTGTADIKPSPDAGGWAPNNLPIDTNGALPGGLVTLFSLNEDLGPDPFDLKDIVVAVASGGFSSSSDPRRNLGEPGSTLGVPFLFGSAFLEWNGRGAVTITLNPVGVSAKLLTNGAFVFGQAPPSAILQVGNYIPEPSSLLLLAVGAFGFLARRR